MVNFAFELEYKNQVVAGVDEVGRGALAGPVVAAAVIINRFNIIEGINDSKKLSKIARQLLYYKIINSYLWSIGVVAASKIDQVNILNATKMACVLAVRSLPKEPLVVLLDGNMKFNDSRFLSIVKGDTKSISVAAASIIAKVVRDNIMNGLAREFYQYKWHMNCGYGTMQHYQAIADYGVTGYHRTSFNLKQKHTN